MREATVGQLLLESALPPDLVGTAPVLDKKGVQRLFDALAEKGPEAYTDASRKLMQVARESAFASGGMSFGLRHLLRPPAAHAASAEIQRKIDAILARDLDRPARRAAIAQVLREAQAPMSQAILDEALAEGNPLALQVLSGSRGNAMSLKGLLGGDLQYVDSRGRPIPFPVLRSYAEGMSPAEYFAGAYGARKGVWDTKKATAQTGYFGKQMMQAAHRLVVTDRDDDGRAEPLRGLPVDVADPANAGAYLAHPVAGYARNTLLTPRVLKDMQARGVDTILVRSPTVGGPAGGGVYSKDLGVRERGGEAPVGDFVGIAAAQALAEKLTQGGLGSKHSGGVSGAAASVGGFPLLDALVQSPKTFPGGATHTDRDGLVADVVPAAQGGHYVSVGTSRYHVPEGQTPVVEPGQEVEAGDVLSDGVPRPDVVVRHKGVGEGRRYFTRAFLKAYRDAGMTADRRNVELLARGLIDHVELRDELGDYLPGDVVSYQDLERSYTPRPEAKRAGRDAAVGQYLEQPVLHHTIGTRVTRRMLPELERFGVDQVLVHPEPPAFVPRFVPGRDAVRHDPDWMTRFLGSNLERGLLEAAHRGRVSDPEGTSFVPAVAERGTFGARGQTRGWDPADLELSGVPRDADRDGLIEDATPRERPDPRRRLTSLLSEFRSR